MHIFELLHFFMQDAKISEHKRALFCIGICGNGSGCLTVGVPFGGFGGLLGSIFIPAKPEES